MTRPLITASTTSPRMSSRIAAPRMTCPSRLWRDPRSFRTRAVMPTLVAVSVAPTNRCARVGASGTNHRAVPHPRANGVTTPITATNAADGPTRTSARRSASSPTSNSNTSTPISARTCSVGSPRTKAMPCSPKKGGSRFPAPMPTRSSPSTEGCPNRSAASPPTFAPTMRSARPKRIGLARDGASPASAMHRNREDEQHAGSPASANVASALAATRVEVPKKPGPRMWPSPRSGTGNA